MKAAEKELLIAIANKQESQNVREVCQASEIPIKRCWYYLEKWGEKDWYDWGVCLDLGWLTKEGFDQAIALESIRL